MPPPAGQEIGDDSHGAAILRLSVLVGTSRGAGRLFNQQVHFRRNFCPFPAVDKRCFTISSGLVRDCLDSAESRSKSRRRISFSNRHATAHSPTLFPVLQSPADDSCVARRTCAGCAGALRGAAFGNRGNRASGSRFSRTRSLFSAPAGALRLSFFWAQFVQIVCKKKRGETKPNAASP